MNIVHIEAGRHFYGGPLQALLLMEGLARAGHENTLVCAKGAKIGEKAKGLARVMEISLGGEVDVFSFWRLKRLLASLRPDLVHVHSRRGADLWAGLAARALGIPAVLTRRVDNKENPFSSWKYRFYAKVAAISRAVADELGKAGVPGDKIRLIPSALEVPPKTSCDRSRFLRAFGLEEGQVVAGTVAQLIPRKGIDVLIRALPQVVRRHPQARFLVFGAGKAQKSLFELRDALQMGEYIRFVGHREDLDKIYPCLAFLVHPARKEGMGVAVLEAMAFELAVVASAAGGIVDVVEDGKTGLLVPPGDEKALAQAINTLLSSPGLAQEMGERGRQKIIERFSPEAMVEGYLALYREILGG